MFYISVTAMICNKCEQLETEIKVDIESKSKRKQESERINALRVQMIDIINYYRNTFDILIVFWLTESLFGALITLNSIYCLVLNENMQIIDIISYYYHFCAQTFTGLIIFVAFNCVKVSLKRFQKPI
jgi:ABC-type uncharacterized transport system fused permease/ATPase subunit